MKIELNDMKEMVVKEILDLTTMYDFMEQKNE
jgi:hypothetical protein